MRVSRALRLWAQAFASKPAPSTLSTPARARLPPSLPLFSHAPRSYSKQRGPKTAKPEQEAKQEPKDQRQADRRAAKADRKAKGDGAAQERVEPDPEEPFNLEDVDAEYKQLAARCEAQLSQQRVGGRFTQGYLEQVPVRADKGSAAEVPLVQVAGVAFRGGRRWSILCHEERLKTAVKSAFLRSPHFNQQPQDSPDNETELLVMVEPERPEELEKRTKETCHVWREAIRQVQTRRDKVHKQWRANRIIVADDQKVLVKMMQQKQDAQMAIVKKKEQEALAAIQKMAHI